MTTGKHLQLSLYWLATNMIWGALLGPVLSTQVALLAPKNSAETLAVLLGVAAIPALVIPLIIGPISDRFRSRLGRRRPFIELGGTATIAGLVLMSFGFGTFQPGLFMLGFVIVQLGSNTALAAYMALIPDQVPVDDRGRASAYMAVMSNAATFVGLGIAQLTASAWYTELVLGALFMAVLIVFLRGLKERPAAAELDKIDWSKWLKSLWISPKDHPDFAWVWITRALMMLGFYMIQPFLVYYLRDLIGIRGTGNEVVSVLALVLLAATASAFFAGKASDKLGRKPLVRISALVVGLSAIAFPFLRNLSAAMAVGLVFGIGYGAYISVDWALGTEVLPNKDDTAKDMGIWHIAMILPQQIGSFVAGYLILTHFHGPKILFRGEMVVSYLAPGYVVLFAIAAVCCAVSGLLITKVKGVR